MTFVQRLSVRDIALVKPKALLSMCFINHNSYCYTSFTLLNTFHDLTTLQWIYIFLRRILLHYELSLCTIKSNFLDKETGIRDFKMSKSQSDFKSHASDYSGKLLPFALLRDNLLQLYPGIQETLSSRLQYPLQLHQDWIQELGEICDLQSLTKNIYLIQNKWYLQFYFCKFWGLNLHWVIFPIDGFPSSQPFWKPCLGDCIPPVGWSLTFILSPC